MPTLTAPRPCLWHRPDDQNICKKCWARLHFHRDFKFWYKVRRAVKILWSGHL